MDIPKTVLCCLLACLYLIKMQAQPDMAPLERKVDFISRTTGQAFPLQFYLPPGYEKSTERYQLLVVLDGQWHFQHVAGLVDFLSGYSQQIPPLIVLGIDVGDRNRFFTPTALPGRPGSGDAALFLRILREEILPYVDRQYRTLPYRSLAGHSLAGLFCLYALGESPQLFQSFFAASPFVVLEPGWVSNQLVKLVTAVGKHQPGVYLSVGEREIHLFPSVDSLYRPLQKVNPNQTTLRVLPGHDHASGAHAAFYESLSLLYQNWVLPDSTFQKGLAAVQQHFHKLSSQFGYPVNPPELLLNRLAYRLLNEEQTEEAVAAFQWWIEQYPSSPNAFDGLGEAFERREKLEEARENFQKAVELGRLTKHPNLAAFQAHLNRVDGQIKNKTIRP